MAALIFGVQALDGADPVEELSRNYPAFTVGTFTAKLSYTLEPKRRSSTVKTWQVYTDLPKWKTVFHAATTVVESAMITIIA